MECDFCGEEFEEERNLHLHWGNEHEKELNSHQEEKVKKAERKQQERDEKRKKERRKLAGWAFAGVIGLAFIAAVGPQLVSSFNNSPQQSFDLSGEPVMGAPDANVTVVAFEDYQCPYCAQFETAVFPRLKKDYIDTGKVKFYFINLAFLGEDSTEAAVASECVYKQDKEQFWKFHASVFENRGREHSGWVTTERMMEIARQSTSGLDYGQLKSCIKQEKTISEVRDDRQAAQSHGVSATPTIFVNGKQVSNPLNYQVLKTRIENELQ
ncbi:MAG: DsbA family protein [Candidatus Nanohaloarchaea archaeon]